MRVFVSMEVGGSTMEETLTNLVARWRKFMNDEAAMLPSDSELSVSQAYKTPDEGSNEPEYTAMFTVRTKVDTDAIK